MGERVYYDRFRDRLMFPIRDTRGRVIGLRWPGARPGRAEVPELTRDRAVSQGPGAVRTLRDAPGARRRSSGCWSSKATWIRCGCIRPGLPYAVATLGTATTPEHLRRAFRLVSEIVFCFDGDRAGRAAAWRALQNALPEAREGREIRFLFLPDGEDPDSLVGREGARVLRAAHRPRRCRCPNIWSRSCATELDLRHADGKARLDRAARDRCSRRYRPASIESCCSTASPKRCSRSAEQVRHWLTAPDRTVGAGSAAPRPRRAAMAPGRGSLVTQSISLLLHFPSAAAAVSAEQVAALTRAEQRASPCCASCSPS